MIINNLEIEQAAKLNNVIYPPNTIVKTLNGTSSLSVTSATVQILSGNNTGFSLILPDATTLQVGHRFEFYNTGTSTMLVKTFHAVTPVTLFNFGQNSTAYLYLVDNSTAAGTWLSWQSITSPDVASGLQNYSLLSSTTFTTTSATDVLITGYTLTPIAGTYMVMFNADITIATNNALLRASIYKNAVLVANSTRIARAGAATWSGQTTVMSTIQFNGAETCYIRVRSSSGSISILSRALHLIRVGN